MMKAKMPDSPTVFVVDDDNVLREGLVTLFRSMGMQARGFGSAKEFLQSKVQDIPGCLVVDVRLPGMSGLDFQTELARAGIQIPIIFISGHADVPMSVKAMKGGAVEFLIKPFREQELLDAVQTAMERDEIQRESRKANLELRARFESLTPREQEVFTLVAAGLMNKQIAAKIAISQVTVKVHRGSVVRKMRAKSLAELVRMADALGLQKVKA